MNLVELNAIKTHLAQQVAQINRINVNCESCTKFAVSECQEFKAAPPEDWIRGTVDCEFWSWDGVPF